jgi:hypothetical protein
MMRNLFLGSRTLFSEARVVASRTVANSNSLQARFSSKWTYVRNLVTFQAVSAQSVKMTVFCDVGAL